MSTNGNALNHHAADFRKKVSALGHDVEDLSAMTKEMVGDAIGTLQTHATKYYDRSMKKVGGLERRLERKISEMPLTSLLVAAGVGWVAGAFLYRR